MKMFVWNAENLTRFGNWYGESMLCIVAESLNAAMKMIKEKDLDLWNMIVEKIAFEPCSRGTVYPAFYKDLIKEQPFFIQGQKYLELFCKDGNFIKSKEKEYMDWRHDLKDQADDWFNENILNEDGLSPYMHMPIEVDLTQPQYFISRASD